MPARTRSSCMRRSRPFFFQAEDGIRDTSVTGVQTCALPILVYIPAYETVRPGGGTLAHGKLVAYDPIKQAPRWVVTLPLSVNGGVLGTAGNLVFQIGRASCR